MKRILFACILALAGQAHAGAWASGCQYIGGTFTGFLGTPSKGSTQIPPSSVVPPVPPSGVDSVGDSSILCYRWTAGEAAHNAGPFQVNTSTAQILYDPDLSLPVAAAAASMEPHVCLGGSYSTTIPPAAGNCPGIGPLTGIEGGNATQTTTVWVGPGLYYLQIPVCAGGATCEVMIRGGGD